MENTYKESLNVIQNGAVYATALAGVVSAAVTHISPSSDIVGACEVLHDYMDRTADIIEELIFRMDRGD